MGDLIDAFQKANESGECPVCPFCNQPLKIICQTELKELMWNWSETDKCYYKSDDGSTEKPFCANCGNKDWDYTDETYFTFY